MKRNLHSDRLTLRYAASAEWSQNSGIPPPKATAQTQAQQRPDVATAASQLFAEPQLALLFAPALRLATHHARSPQMLPWRAVPRRTPGNRNSALRIHRGAAAKAPRERIFPLPGVATPQYGPSASSVE